MARGYAGVLGQIDRLWNLGVIIGMTDAQLLARVSAQHEDGAKLAFEALVERHGPMVFCVCRDILRDEHVAEDTFQATFLVLARKLRSLWVQESLGSWLYNVAYRVASRARSDAARRCRHERWLAKIRGLAWEVTPDRHRFDTRAILSEEIARLPEKYRAPIVLCYLEAMSYEEAAALLGATKDGVRGRLARARERLRKRSTRRGVEIPDVLAAVYPSITEVAPRPGWVKATARAVMDFAAGKAASSGIISQSVVSLGERTYKTMMLNKLWAPTVSLALGIIAAGAIVSAQPMDERNEQEAPSPTIRRPLQAMAGGGGNLIVDWIPGDGKGGKKEIIVDPTRHCIHMSPMSLKRDDRLNDCVVRLDLERGKIYTVTASGEAFMSEQTGVDADPSPGIVLLYSTDEEDCYAERQAIISPGKSITFRSPWLIDPKADVYLMAFFLDTWPGQRKRGSFTLTITEADENSSSKTQAKHAVRRNLKTFPEFHASRAGFEVIVEPR